MVLGVRIIKGTEVYVLVVNITQIYKNDKDQVDIQCKILCFIWCFDFISYKLW